jgi:hypothetical protein
MAPAKRFVWWSIDESVKDGIPSALAALEVVVAVAAYWAIAIYFETTTHLWVSICVAPLLLLRSEQSIALGAQWFTSYLGEEYHFVSPRHKGVVKLARHEWLSILMTSANLFVVSAVITYLLALELLVGHEGWSLYWRSVVAGLAVSVAAGALPVAVGFGHITTPANFLEEPPQRIAITLAVVAAGAGAGMRAPTVTAMALAAAALGAIPVVATIIVAPSFFLPCGCGASRFDLLQQRIICEMGSKRFLQISGGLFLLLIWYNLPRWFLAMSMTTRASPSPARATRC